MDFYMKKKIIGLVIASILGASSLPAIAANKKEKVEEPLRLRSDRKELVDRLTEEKMDLKTNPISIEEINKRKKELLATEEALEKAAHDPKAMFRTIEVGDNNKTKIRDIFLSPNYATTLIFLDKRGNYWPMDSFVLPLPADVIDRDVINEGTMILTPRAYSAKGNLVVMLKDSKIPLMLTLNIGTDKIDYKTELRIDDYGPNSQVVAYDPTTMAPKKTTDLSSMAKFGSQERYELLDGITSTGYKKRETNNKSVEAWTNGSALMIKTKASLISPSLLQDDDYNFLKGGDGSFLYTVPFMSPIMVEFGGSIVPVFIK